MPEMFFRQVLRANLAKLIAYSQIDDYLLGTVVFGVPDSERLMNIKDKLVDKFALPCRYLF